MLKFRIQEALLRPLLAAAMIVIGIGFGLSQPSEPPEKHEHTEKSDQKLASNNSLKDFWNWTTADAVSFYTFVLAIFTGVLSLIAIVQIRYLIRADKTARISADAAKQSADAAETAFNKLERPYLFIYNAETEGISSVVYVVANHGRTPAIIDNFRAIISSGVKPDAPIRVHDQHELLVTRVIAPNDIYHPSEHAPDGIAFTFQIRVAELGQYRRLSRNFCMPRERHVWRKTARLSSVWVLQAPAPIAMLILGAPRHS